jgi:hypothetical protein
MSRRASGTWRRSDADAIADLGIGLRHALIMPDIFHPGRAFVAFDPELGVTCRATGSLARAVTPPDPPTLGHHGEEGEDVVAADHSTVTMIGRCAAGYRPRSAAAPAAERVEIERGAGQEMRRSAAPTSRFAAASSAWSMPRCSVTQPHPAAARHAAEGRHLVAPGRARPPSGADSCTIELKVDRVSTQHAPAHSASRVDQQPRA